MRSSNPMFRESFVKSTSATSGQSMTASGAANKASILMFIVFATAFFSWSSVSAAGGAGSGLFIGVGAIGGLVLALITAFKPVWAPITSPIYAALEGLFLGALSFTFEAMFPGIAVQAVLGTMCVTLIMLFLYQARIIKVTERFRAVVTAAIMAIAAVYLISFVVSFFAPQYSIVGVGGTLGLIITGAIIVVAALALLLDFDMIEKAETFGMGKYMEWYCAFSLLVTLIWLYIEMLRFISIFRGNE